MVRHTLSLERFPIFDELRPIGLTQALSEGLSLTGGLPTPNDENGEARRLRGGAGLQPARGIQPRSGRRRL